jgi:phosphomannomutase
MLLVNSNIFKAYDIRGIYGEDFDNELGYLVGLAYAELRQSDPDYTPGRKLQIGVGMDMRLSSPALKDNLVRGLLAAGVDVIDLGLVSTPTFYFAISNYNYDGGIMVSASHNPKQWNGFKLVRAKGAPISEDTGIKVLQAKVLANHFILSKIGGHLSINNQIMAAEIAYAFSFTDSAQIKPLKIVVDTANGMGAAYLTPMFAKLPCELIPLNFKLDGTFPAHEADPLKEENLVQLKTEIIRQQADLGIATDGDGDRIFFLDNQGNTISPAIIRGLLAKLFLADKPGANIGYDVRPGKITVDLIIANGGRPIMTRVGHSLIKQQMLRDNIYFAGESSGHFYLNASVGCFEYPVVMILKLLSLFSEAGQSVADFIKPYNIYFSSGEINRSVTDPMDVLEKIITKYSDGKINKLDGVSVEYPDFWFNVRVSNTEAKIRLNLEAVSQAVMEKRRDEVLALMN